MRLFNDRREAALELARLLAYLKREKPIVLGLANGGVPIAEVVAQALEAPLDVLLIERLAAPKNPDHFVGAVDEHGRISMIKSTARWHHLTSQQMVEPARLAFRDLQRKRGKVRAILPELDVRDQTVVIISQGVASGAKMLGAIASVRDRGARKVVAAAPAGSGEAAWQLHEIADAVVIPHRPSQFKSIEAFYQEFSPVTDELVLAIIERWVTTRPQQQPGIKTLVMKFSNERGILLSNEIDLPPGTTRGSGPYPAVIFAHGWESDGRNPRTVPTSRRLAKRGIIGVRVDFSGHGRSQGELEDATPEAMLEDLRCVLRNVRQLEEVDDERLGLVGSGTGAMLALHVAQEETGIRAVVVRGPMCGRELETATAVRAPTLLVYAERDEEYAAARKKGIELPSIHQTVEVPDSTRLFNDTISLELMLGATVDWLDDHLSPLLVEDKAEEAAEAAEETGETGETPPGAPGVPEHPAPEPSGG